MLLFVANTKSKTSLLLQAQAVLALTVAFVGCGSAESFEDMKAPAPKADGGPGFDAEVGTEAASTDDTFHSSVKKCFKDKTGLWLNQRTDYCKWWVLSLVRNTGDAIKVPAGVDTNVIMACVDAALKAKAAGEASEVAGKKKVQVAGAPRWRMITWAFASRCGVSNEEFPRLLTHAFQNIMVFFNNFVHVSNAPQGAELIKTLSGTTTQILVEGGSDRACNMLYNKKGFEAYTWWTLKLLQMAVGKSLERKNSNSNKPVQPWYILAETYEAPPSNNKVAAKKM